jgi:hypothetical protein
MSGKFFEELGGENAAESDCGGAVLSGVPASEDQMRPMFSLFILRENAY